MTSIRARLRAPTRREPGRSSIDEQRPCRARTAGGPMPGARLVAAALCVALAWPATAAAQMAPQPAPRPGLPPTPGVVPPAFQPTPALPAQPAQPQPVLPPLLPPAQPQAQAPAAPVPAPARGRGDRVTLNFVNADIEGVTRAVGAILAQQFVVDPRVRGNMTLYSDQPMTPREVYLHFLAALRGLGYTVVQVGGLYKVVPEADAKLQTDAVSVGQPSRRGDQIVTQIFRLVHENANNLVAVLRPLISPNNTINANPGNNTLVITDYADNLQRIARIIAAVDTPAAADVEVIPLQYAVASDMAALVQRLADGGSVAPGAVPGLAATSVLVDSRSNSLIVRAANPARLASLRSLVARLDRPATGGAAGNHHVVHLKNADAVKLAAVLRAAFSASAQGTPAGGGTTPFGSSAPTPLQTTSGSPFAGLAGGAGATSSAATAPVTPSAAPSTGGFVQADPATNSLVITAPEPLYRQVRAMIDMLDSRRAQVYIESMIVEVTGDNLAEVGFQWQGLIGKPGDSNGVAIGTNSAIAGPSIIGLTQSLLSGGIGGGSGTTGGTATPALPGSGLNVALLRNYFGTYGLAAIARFLQQQGNTNIISTPNLITLDNEEAKIIVGSNVPFITGQFTSTGTATTSPFQTIERKDVGITLRIRPQIGESGTVRMAIFQESSSLSTLVAPGTSNAGPSTDKRSIESTIVVDDGSIIVLGGLIEDRYISNQSKVPLLGDIPYIGGLFRSESRTRRRTNLMVFLRPVVLRDSASQDRLSLDRYELIRSMQIDAQPRRNPLLPIDEVGVLPPARRIDAPSDPLLPGLPQVEVPLAAPQTNPGAQTLPAPAQPR